VLSHDGVKPVVSDVQRIPIGAGEIRDPAALTPFLKEALNTAIPAYAKKHAGIRTVSVILASPWFISSLRTLSSKAEKPVKVSQSSIRKIVSDHRKTEHDDPTKAILEAHPLTVLVNGYRSRVLRSVHGTTLAVTLYESITDLAVKKLVDDTVHASLARAAITWHTTPLAYAETLLRISDEDHATVIDVGGEVTDIFVLSHQNVAYVASIPHGSRTIARTIAGTKDGALADTLSRLAMFARAELTEVEMQTTGKALTDASAEWQKAFLEILRVAGNTVPIPHRVFVVGERDELPWVSQVVMGVETRGQRLLPTIVGNDFFTGLLSYGEGGTFDSSLALDALFFHIQQGSQESVVATPPVLYSVQ
jgi:hypothetical protein